MTDPTKVIRKSLLTQIKEMREALNRLEKAEYEFGDPEEGGRNHNPRCDVILGEAELIEDMANTLFATVEDR